MLLPHHAALPPFAAILLDQERDMPHGLFGDRDSVDRPEHERHAGLPMVPGCGLFGRRSDAPKIRPANLSPSSPAAPIGMPRTWGIA